MALTDITKIDRSYKILQNLGLTSTNRQWYEEAIPSNVIQHATDVWGQLVSAHRTLNTLYVLTQDPGNPNAWIARVTPGDPTSNVLPNWIPPTYNDGLVDYTALVYDNTGVQIPPTDSSNWIFDYKAGILYLQNGIGTHPTPIKITGYTYTGLSVYDVMATAVGDLQAVTTNGNTTNQGIEITGTTLTGALEITGDIQYGLLLGTTSATLASQFGIFNVVRNSLNNSFLAAGYFNATDTTIGANKLSQIYGVVIDVAPRDLGTVTHGVFLTNTGAVKGTYGVVCAGSWTDGLNIQGNFSSSGVYIANTTAAVGTRGLYAYDGEYAIYGHINAVAAKEAGRFVKASTTATSYPALEGINQVVGAGTGLHGVKGSTTSTAALSAGVWGESTSATGVYGTSTSGIGTYGTSTSNDGIYGLTAVVGAAEGTYAGVYGRTSSITGWGSGVIGEATAVAGQNMCAGYFKNGVRALYAKITEAEGTNAGRFVKTSATKDAEAAVYVTNLKTNPNDNHGLYATTSGGNNSAAVYGVTSDGAGVVGSSSNYIGTGGVSSLSTGVYGISYASGPAEGTIGGVWGTNPYNAGWETGVIGSAVAGNNTCAIYAKNGTWGLYSKVSEIGSRSAGVFVKAAGTIIGSPAVSIANNCIVSGAGAVNGLEVTTAGTQANDYAIKGTAVAGIGVGAFSTNAHGLYAYTVSNGSNAAVWADNGTYAVRASITEISGRSAGYFVKALGTIVGPAALEAYNNCTGAAMSNVFGIYGYSAGTVDPTLSVGVYGQCTTGIGTKGASASGIGVYGISNSAMGGYFTCTTGTSSSCNGLRVTDGRVSIYVEQSLATNGIYAIQAYKRTGTRDGYAAVYVENEFVNATSGNHGIFSITNTQHTTTAGVYGYCFGLGIGVRAYSSGGHGLYGQSGTGIVNSAGVVGYNGTYGVWGQIDLAASQYAGYFIKESTTTTGYPALYGLNKLTTGSTNYGVRGITYSTDTNCAGVYGSGDYASGVYGLSIHNHGVHGKATSKGVTAAGVYGEDGLYAVWGSQSMGTGECAGYFNKANASEDGHPAVLITNYKLTNTTGNSGIEAATYGTHEGDGAGKFYAYATGGFSAYGIYSVSEASHGGYFQTNAALGVNRQALFAYSANTSAASFQTNAADVNTAGVVGITTGTGYGGSFSATAGVGGIFTQGGTYGIYVYDAATYGVYVDGTQSYSFYGNTTAGNMLNKMTYSNNVGAVRTMMINSSGLFGVNTSSLRYKENVINMEDINWLYRLRPVNYNRIGDEDKKKEYGLIAEEVYDLCPEMTEHDAQGRPESVEYYRLIPVLLKAIQEQRKEIDQLKKLIKVGG